jgi:hypothetical protein
VARIRNRQEPVTNWLAAGFLATALWIGIAAMAITAGPVPQGGAWAAPNPRKPQRTFVRAAPSIEVNVANKKGG